MTVAANSLARPPAERMNAETGLEERLKEKSLLIREERLFANVSERLEPIRTLHSNLVEGLPIDAAFVSAKDAFEMRRSKYGF